MQAGVNLYQYCRGSPINYVDPTGTTEALWNDGGSGSSAGVDPAIAAAAAEEEERVRAGWLAGEQSVMPEPGLHEPDRPLAALGSVFSDASGQGFKAAAESNNGLEKASGYLVGSIMWSFDLVAGGLFNAPNRFETAGQYGARATLQEDSFDMAADVWNATTEAAHGTVGVASVLAPGLSAEARVLTAETRVLAAETRVLAAETRVLAAETGGLAGERTLIGAAEISPSGGATIFRAPHSSELEHFRKQGDIFDPAAYPPPGMFASSEGQYVAGYAKSYQAGMFEIGVPEQTMARLRAAGQIAKDADPAAAARGSFTVHPDGLPLLNLEATIRHIAHGSEELWRRFGLTP